MPHRPPARGATALQRRAACIAVRAWCPAPAAPTLPRHTTLTPWLWLWLADGVQVAIDNLRVAMKATRALLATVMDSRGGGVRAP